MVKITKAKLKISNDGVFAIVGKGMYGEDKNVLIDDYSLIGYVKICSDWFEIKECLVAIKGIHNVDGNIVIVTVPDEYLEEWG